MVDYLVPSRMRTYRMRVERRALRDRVLEIRLSLDSFFYRAVTSPMNLTVDARTGRLLEFDGVSGLLDARDRPVHVRITYDDH